MNIDVQQAAGQFRRATQSFVTWIDKVSTSASDFRALHRALLELQAAALDLPPVSDEDFDDAADALKGSLKHNQQVQRLIAAHLPATAYSLVFNPLDENDRVAILTTLDDDLADIYWDVADGIALCNAGYYGDAVWHWRFSYFTHWGRHAVHAQTAIWQYLSDNQDEL